MNIKDLTDITFCETNPGEIEKEIISTFEQLAESTLYPGDPVRLFLEGLAYVITQQRYLIDATAKQNLLAYAGGDNLEHLGAFLGVSRLPEAFAEVDVEFSKSPNYAGAVTIPQGTRVSPDNQIFYETIESGEIAAGESTVTLRCRCQMPGSAYNGFSAGQIALLVDPVAYVASAVNTTTSLGGADAETDEHLRDRIRIAPEQFSNAGPTGAYVYYAKSAHPDIVDVSVTSPSPGVINVYPLKAGGELPDAAVISAVEDLLSGEKARPLTDSVSVLTPTAVNYDIDVTYYIETSKAGLTESITAAVEKAVDKYVENQSEKLGRDINPTELIYRLYSAGVKRVEVTSPVFAILTAEQVAQLGTRTVAFGGYEDE
ncbi:baseplate assembly protein [Limisalsivibrio acetivorans]|uniref:baseplate assembly protein n=1 Tax=Limisalsivibrio acetivorans TaxID=1304888 RepID=UPI0003B3F593|nr:baseplate J/gp47 family protein [Limisalsivibrio acetivorans]